MKWPGGPDGNIVAPQGKDCAAVTTGPTQSLKMSGKLLRLLDYAQIPEPGRQFRCECRYEPVDARPQVAYLYTD
jgi:hypothetical protein